MLNRVCKDGSHDRRPRSGAALRRALLVGAVALSALGAAGPAQAAEGIQKIQHVVMIMQENRSFDSYFGTYPGARGIPAGVCVPDPLKGKCVAPYHLAGNKNFGGQHGTQAAVKDINGGKMDGFIAQAEKGKNCNPLNPTCGACDTSSTPPCEEVMGYHDARELPNYWGYAQNYVLQDNLFESSLTASLRSHGYMVSAWFGVCPNGDKNPLDCVEKEGGSRYTTRSWTDVTYLLAKAGVSWRYYVMEGIEPDCESDEAVTCSPVTQGAETPSIWNPLPTFTDVAEDGQSSNVQSLNNYYFALGEPATCGLPNVSWIAPSDGVSEHPPALVSTGQTYVTTLINAIMRSPCWNSTAIFVSWDDWGGLYDHVVPPTIDKRGYGLRVPGFVVSPYARAGYIDHQQLSYDAWLKFIEDDFLAGARLNPATDGRPDKRPDVREAAPGLGSLVNDFNFNQPPRAPVILSAHSAPGSASSPPGSAQPPALETAPATSITGGKAKLNATVNPDGTNVSSCRFEYGTTTSYGSSAPCASLPGSGVSPVEVSASVSGLKAGTAYHFRIAATNTPGTSLGPDLAFVA